MSQCRSRWSGLLSAGPKTRTRLFYADARFANRIRLLAMGDGASRRTTRITIGSGFAGAAVSDAERPSPFCRCFLSPTRITVCWHAARHYCIALWSTVRGRRRRRSSGMLTAYRIPLPCADGCKVWTSHSWPCLFSTRRLRERLGGWNLLTRIRTDPRSYRGLLRCSKSSALCAAEKKSFSPPSLPGNSGVVLLRWAPEAKRRCG